MQHRLPRASETPSPPSQATGGPGRRGLHGLIAAGLAATASLLPAHGALAAVGGGLDEINWIGPANGLWLVPEHWQPAEGPPRVPEGSESAVLSPGDTVRLVGSAPWVEQLVLKHGFGTRLHVDGGSLATGFASVGQAGTGMAEVLVTGGSLSAATLRIGTAFLSTSEASVVVTGGTLDVATVRVGADALFHVGPDVVARVAEITDLGTQHRRDVVIEGEIALFYIPELDRYIPGVVETRGRLSLGGESIHMLVDVPRGVPAEDEPVLLTPVVRIHGGMRLRSRLTVPPDHVLRIDPALGADLSVLCFSTSFDESQLCVDGTLDLLGGRLSAAGLGLLEGTGRIIGVTSTHTTTIRPGRREAIGTLTMEGSLILGTFVELELDVAGVGPGMVDLIRVDPPNAGTPATVDLGGTLVVQTGGGYQPAFGDVVRIMAWPADAEVRGDFGGVLVPWIFDLPDGMYPTWSVEATGVDVAFVRGEHPCPGDLVGDGTVDMQDLTALLGAWGARGGHADLDGSGVVGLGDLLVLLGAFGACEAPAGG